MLVAGERRRAACDAHPHLGRDMGGVAGMAAHDCRGAGDDRRAHHTTSSAPPLMLVCGPCSLIDAPIPLSISIPDGPRPILAPMSVLSSNIAAPGVSVMVT